MGGNWGEGRRRREKEGGEGGNGGEERGWREYTIWNLRKGLRLGMFWCKNIKFYTKMKVEVSLQTVFWIIKDVVWRLLVKYQPNA